MYGDIRKWQYSLLTTIQSPNHELNFFRKHPTFYLESYWKNRYMNLAVNFTIHRQNEIHG